MKNMKNRGIYLFVFVCLCLFCLLGALYFMGSDSQNQVPIKIYKATTFLNDKTVNELDLDREPPQNVAATDPDNADILQPTLRKPDKDEIEKARFLQIEQSPEYQDFVDSKMQELVKEYNQTGVLNFSFQEFFDFFTSQGMPHVDFAQGAHEAFREYFPTGEPEDYDVEMATRFLEVFLETHGTTSEASLYAANSLYAEPDFSAWILGRFKGELAPQLQWFDEQTAIATRLRNAFSSSDIEEQAPLPALTEDEKASSSTSTSELPLSNPHNIETLEGEKASPPTSISELPLPNPHNIKTVDAPTPLSTERILSIRETLRHYGTYNGMSLLLETDAEATRWLFENFNSLEQIKAWMSENANEMPPLEP